MTDDSSPALGNAAVPDTEAEPTQAEWLRLAPTGRVALLALGLGIAGDQLLRATPWGLNAFLWMLTFSLAVAYVLKHQDTPSKREAAWLLYLALGFAACIAWRDSATLKTLDALAIFALLALLAARNYGFTGSWRQAGFFTHWNAQLLALSKVCGGGFLFLNSDTPWRCVRTIGWASQTRSVITGIGIAVPLLFVFGSLLVSADEGFSRMVDQLFVFDLSSLVRHAILIGFIAWCAVGYLRLFENRLQATTKLHETRLPPWRFVGAIEVGIPLATLDLLFVSFLLVQANYFFGGDNLVQQTAGLTYAEYARRGFFELCAVAALALPVLLVLNWLLREAPTQAQRIYRVLAGCMVALIFCLMLSALFRMRLYHLAYGLTELRVYTVAFMLWLAVVFGWFAATCLRGRQDRFSFGMLATALCAVFLLHVVNPDALIARKNLDRAHSGRDLDVNYLTNLSADAHPVLLADFDKLSRMDQIRVRRDLPELELNTWTWSWSRWRAQAAREAS